MKLQAIKVVVLQIFHIQLPNNCYESLDQLLSYPLQVVRHAFSFSELMFWRGR